MPAASTLVPRHPRVHWHAVLAGLLLAAGSRVVAAQGAGATGVVTGRVVRPGGAPVSGVVVAVGYRGTDTAVTSDNGRFAIHDVSPGPHMIVARHLGSRASRIPLTLTPGETKDVAITLAPAVPVLATVTTTAAVTAGYHQVGLDRRMHAGMGQFVTYDQIMRQRASTFTDLLELVHGLHLTNYANAEGATTLSGGPGRGSCIGLLVDGMPQDVRTTDEVNEALPIDVVAAIEYYRASEAPAGWAAIAPGQDSTPSNKGVTEAPTQSTGANGTTTPTPGPPMANAQRPMGTAPADAPRSAAKGKCDIVAVWTKSRLGLTADGPADESPPDASPTTAHVVLPKAPACAVRPSDDSLDVGVYASLLGGGNRTASDSSWLVYTRAVLSTVQKAYAMPSELDLAAFGSPLRVNRRDQGVQDTALRIAPALSTVVSFSLDSTGAASDLRLRASSLSGGGDTSALAAVAEAAGAHAFPAIPQSVTDRSPVHFAFVLSTADAPAGAPSIAVGRLSVPTWKVAQEATLAADSQPSLGGDVLPPGVAADTVALQFVVDERGHPVMTTARVVGTRSQGSTGPAHQQLVERVVRALPRFTFTPTLIGTCPVPATVTQVFGWRRR